jgi:hypothetical protein
MESQGDVAAPSSAAGLTLDRECEICHGRGEPPTDDELEQLEEIRKLDDALALKVLPQVQEAAQVAKAASNVVGCGTHELTERHGKRFGKLTAQDIVEQGRRGLRGRRALDAALIMRGRSRRTPHGHEPVQRARPASRTPRRSRRVGSRVASSRGSPRSDDDEPEPSRAASRHSRISCPAELDLLFIGSGSGEAKRIICAYCGGRTRGVRDSASAWFLSHQCDGVNEDLARRNRELIRIQGGNVFEVVA